MQALTFWKTITMDYSDLLEKLIALLAENDVRHSVGKMLALAYVRTTHAWPGAKLLVQSAGRQIVATIAQTPFFDPAGNRLRAKYG